MINIYPLYIRKKNEVSRSYEVLLEHSGAPRSARETSCVSWWAPQCSSWIQNDRPLPITTHTVGVLAYLTALLADTFQANLPLCMNGCNSNGDCKRLCVFFERGVYSWIHNDRRAIKNLDESECSGKREKSRPRHVLSSPLAPIGSCKRRCQHQRSSSVFCESPPAAQLSAYFDGPPIVMNSAVTFWTSLSWADCVT